jgi:regulator of replication initiation timing
MNLLNKREDIKKENKKYIVQLEEAEEEQNKLKQQTVKFESSINKIKEIYSGGEDKPGQIKEGPKMQLNPANDQFLQKIRNDPFYSYEKARLENIRHYGDKEYKEVKINPEAKDQNKQLENKRINDLKYYCDYKKKQFDRHQNYINNKFTKSKEKMNEYAKISQDSNNLMEKLKLNFSLMIKMKRGQDEVTDDLFMEKEEKPDEQIIENEGDDNLEPGDDEQQDNLIPEEEIEEVPINQEELDKRKEEEQMQEFLKRSSGVPVENSMLIDRDKIMELNDELQKYYKMKMDSERTNKDHTQMKQYLTLENELLQVLTMDITLKMKYLKLTRVTKKIQEVVTGKEEINQAQIAKLYEDKKRNLEENTSKRIATLDKKFREINNDIKKKVEENHAFNIKLNHLKDDVVKTQQIIDLDEDVEKADEIGYTGEEHKPGVVPNKSLEIAEVSKLKSIVKNYYEEIEYLRAELDKLRARTFPSFLQKPDNVIYPDEK